ncbi:MAG: hypothetical protein K8R57_05265 [Verrucomicrobia bacterium]|nr:hypothetical protein [Verrucomicrobiota bacterium]
MKSSVKKSESDFILSAKRAFGRVNRSLRAENARLGLPLIQGVNGKLTLVKLTALALSEKRR